MQDISTRVSATKISDMWEDFVLSEEGIREQQFRSIHGWKIVQKYPPLKREGMKGAHIQFPGWPYNTLELSWWDTWDGAAFQKVSALQAGEVCIIHQGRVRNTTVKASAAHVLVPVARGTSEENPFLETENVLLSKAYIISIIFASWLW